MKIISLVLLLLILFVLIPSVAVAAIADSQTFFQEISKSKESVLYQVNPISRNRDWRLLEVQYQNAASDSGDFETNKYDLIFYHDGNTTQLDSIITYLYDGNIDEYIRHQRHYYQYDESGQYVTRQDYYLRYYGSTETSYYLFQYCYDDMNRLDHLIHVGNTLNYRCCYIYDIEGHLVQEFRTYNNPGSSPSYYKWDYEHDAQGRISGYTTSGSSDSLNWVALSIIDYEYNPADTSSDALYVDFLAHEFTYYYYNHDIGLSQYGMVSESLSQNIDLIDSTWVMNHWETYSYDNENRLSEGIHHLYYGYWQPFLKVNPIYDANGNEVCYNRAIWDWNINDWGDISSRNIYTWGQFNSITDETIPLNTLAMSVYPNPFRDKVRIELDSDIKTPAKIDIYNVKGQLVKSYSIKSGESVYWDGKDKRNLDIGNGLYLLKASQDKIVKTGKLIRVK